jgi:hypothetical protein
MNLVSQRVFEGFVAAITLGLAVPWFAYDGYRLIRLRTADGSTDPTIGDKRFGYVIGMLIGIIGVIGVVDHCFWHHLE